jgi:hypothetical protein
MENETFFKRAPWEKLLEISSALIRIHDSTFAVISHFDTSKLQQEMSHFKNPNR